MLNAYFWVHGIWPAGWIPFILYVVGGAGLKRWLPPVFFYLHILMQIVQN